jgi:hypothetical protein
VPYAYYLSGDENEPSYRFLCSCYRNSRLGTTIVRPRTRIRRRKRFQDATDVTRLMALKVPMKALLRVGHGVWEDEILFSEEFIKLTRERVGSYVDAFPDRAEEWKALGFSL